MREDPLPELGDESDSVPVLDRVCEEEEQLITTGDDSAEDEGVLGLDGLLSSTPILDDREDGGAVNAAEVME